MIVEAQKSNKVANIIGYYVFAILCLALLYWLEKIEILGVISEKFKRHYQSLGFGLYMLAGFAKLALLILGTCIPIILTYMLIREKRKNKQKK